MEDTATTSASSSSGAQLFRQPLPPKGVDKNLAAVLAPMQAASSDGNLQCHSPPPSSHIPLPLSSSSSPLPPLTLLGDSAHCSSSHQHHHHHNYHHHLASSPGPHAHKGGVGGVGGWGHSSPVTAQWSSTGQIQSVPPWFIFSTKKPELEKVSVRVCVCVCVCVCVKLFSIIWKAGIEEQKLTYYFVCLCRFFILQRMRLTEAINRSLMETPSQNPKVGTYIHTYIVIIPSHQTKP